MTTDITTIPEQELRKDLEDSYADIIACEAALKLGITTHNGYDVAKRKAANEHFVKVITAELLRRGKSSVVVLPKAKK